MFKPRDKCKTHTSNGNIPYEKFPCGKFICSSLLKYARKRGKVATRELFLPCPDFQHQELRRKLKWTRTYRSTAPLRPHMAQLTLLPQPPATAPLICTVARTRLIIVLSQRLIRRSINSGVIGVQRPISSLFIGRPGILLA